MAKRLKLGELLIKGGAIDKIQLGAALADQRQFRQPLGKILVQMGFLDEEKLVRTLARQLSLPVAWLKDKWVDPQVIELIPAELALKHQCLPLSVELSDSGKLLHVAMHDPHNLEALDALRFLIGHKISPVLAAPSELDDAIQRHYQSDSYRPPQDADGTIDADFQSVAPELMHFVPRDTVADTPVQPEPTLELVTEIGEVAAAAPVKPTGPAPSAEAAIGAVTQLLGVLLDAGIVTRDQAAKQLRDFLKNRTGGNR